jgi:hypothetical protein
MATSGVRFKPNFVLKGIDPNEIKKKYSEGKYNNLHLPPSRIRLSSVSHVSTAIYGSSPNDPKYQFKDKNNMSIVVVTSNTKKYDMYFRGIFENEKGGRCWWCLRDFVHKPVHIPIHMEKMKRDDKTYYCFWSENIRCCGYRCAYAWVLRQALIDPLYKLSDYYLRMIFHFQYPNHADKILKPADDPQLLEVHGGSHKNEDFDKNNYFYKRTSNVVLLPAKVEYLQNRTE